VSVLNGASTVQFYADALNENTLNINGNSGKSVALTPDGTTYTAKNESADTKGADSAYTRGFHLAGVDIPYPTGDYVQKTGTVSLAGDAALCWVQRCTTEGKVAWVLSLVNGSCPATKTNISCGGSLPDFGDPLDPIIPDKSCNKVGQSCNSGVGDGKGVWVTDALGGCCCEVVCSSNLPEGINCPKKCLQTSNTFL
ncbi:MAG: hypothetical protein J6C49_00610, partial [Elusimicrobiaceae bacterium]|nr:hypothetical protein [Elusimicrobiaceae bacterium]